MAEMNSPSDTTGMDPRQLVSNLQALWTKKKMQELQEEAKQGFASLAEPMSELLDMLEACKEGKGKVHSIGYCIASEFQHWIKKQPSARQSGLRLKKLQARVFSLISEGRTSIVDPLIDIYQLSEADRDFLLGHVSHMHLKGKYKEAAILSTKLNLQLDLDVEKMCTPLYFLDKTNLMEAYVVGHPHLQSQLLQMLDRWSRPDFNWTAVIRQYNGLLRIQHDKLKHQILSKLVFRLLEQFHIDPAVCPNVVNQRHLGTLKYLFYKRFVEKSMTQENWSDHIRSTVGQNPWLQEQMLQLLHRYSDIETVARWAVYYNVPHEQLPSEVIYTLQSLQHQERLHVVENSCDTFEVKKRDCYLLPIPKENIHFLHSLAELDVYKPAMLKPGQVLGIDMEWRPTFGTLEKSNVSLIQIAVKEHVFLLDLLQISNEVEDIESDLANFITAIFIDSTITKLGYGMSGDLQCLVPTCPSFKDLDKKVKGVLDLLPVHKLLQKSRTGRLDSARTVDDLPDVPGSSIDGFTLPEKGLSLLVQNVLGKPLDKTQQLSDWEKRPLREEQILYAACDAYCLLDVYEALSADASRYGLNINLSDFLNESQHKTPKVKKPKKAVEKSLLKLMDPLSPEMAPTPETAFAQHPPVSPRELSVVCDNMLQGLGRYLRCLGVDVRMLENDDDHRKAAELARQEGRVILTCGLPYQTLRSQVGEGKCFLVDCSEKAKDQAIRVLKHFNVRVALSDVFSRCQVCNCNRYLKISNLKMRQLMVLQGLLALNIDTNLECNKDELTERPSSKSSTSSTQETSSTSPSYFSYNPNCKLLEEQDLSPDSAKLANGATLQIAAIPKGLLDKVDLFYCCSQCGKVFWEGSHFGRVVSQFEEVLLDISGKDFYQMNAGI